MKFKIWDIKNNEWCPFTNLFKVELTSCLFNIENGIFSIDERITNFNIVRSLQQYDSQDTEIYEYDILKISYEKYKYTVPIPEKNTLATEGVFVVRWSEENAAFLLYDATFLGTGYLQDSGKFIGPWLRLDYFTKIGTIFENPELLTCNP